MIQIEYKGVPFSLADDPNTPSTVVLGVRKSGSSILNSMVTALAQRQGLTYVDVAGLLFKAGVKVVDWQRDPGLNVLLKGGNVLGGFRNFPIGLQNDPQFGACRKILLVRDPRDALVSEYFSNAYSHSLPKSGEGLEQMKAMRQEALSASIEAYVSSRAGEFRKTLMEYAPLVGRPETRIFHYEQVITQKRQLLLDICAHFGWEADPGFISQVLQWADVVPGEERPTEFVRKVLPGDHRDKLSPALIDRLNVTLEDVMSLFGYKA